MDDWIAFLCCGNSTTDNDRRIAVAASFAEIREQCAWIGGLVGFPMLAGLPDTYTMMATGGKGLKGLDAERPVGGHC